MNNLPPDPRYSSNPVPPPPPGIPAPTPPKSKLPWILAGCGCAALIAFAVLGGGIYAFTLARKTQEAVKGTRKSLVFKTYTSTPDNIPAGLRQHFVPFEFHYPKKFEVVPSEENFIKIEEAIREGTDGDFTLENFAVGYITIPANADNNTVYPVLLGQLAAQLAKGFPGFREISQAPETVSGERGRAMLWQALMRGTPKGDVTFYGKVVLVRRPSQPIGVAIIMIATSLDPEVKSPAAVGVKGDLATVLRSFKLLAE